MELEDFQTNLKGDALAIKQLAAELSECADVRCLNKIYAVAVLADHQLSLLERMADLLKNKSEKVT